MFSQPHEVGFKLSAQPGCQVGDGEKNWTCASCEGEHGRRALQGVTRAHGNSHHGLRNTARNEDR
jgi:hypothetical protein